jgi:hypothetical protein
VKKNRSANLAPICDPSPICFNLYQPLITFLHLFTGDTVAWIKQMKFKKRAVLGVLLSTGLYLLDNLRERMPDNIDDIKGKARETYETASDRLGRAADTLRGKEDSQMLGNVGALLLGVGIGAGVGLLFAPASGEATRAEIANKVSAFGERVRQRRPQGATATHGA